MKKTKIKPQRGVTYECYMGYTDRVGTRVRRKRKYLKCCFHSATHYYMTGVSGRGFLVVVPRDKFTSHFVPVNPLPQDY